MDSFINDCLIICENRKLIAKLRFSIIHFSNLSLLLHKIKTIIMSNQETIKRMERAEKTAWIIFFGIGLNYLLLTLILNVG